MCPSVGVLVFGAPKESKTFARLALFGRPCRARHKAQPLRKILLCGKGQAQGTIPTWARQRRTHSLRGWSPVLCRYRCAL
jgi:hypothetical protein